MTRYALIAEPDARRASEYLALVADLGLDGVLAADGAEAQAVLHRRGPPALLVTELALPRVDGFALLSELRARPSPRPTAVLVSTAYDELRLMAWPHRHRLGIQGFLNRRASADTLREAFREALEGRPPSAPEPVTLAASARTPGLPNEAVPVLAEPLEVTQELQGVVEAVAEAFGVPVALLSLEDGKQRRTVAHMTLRSASPSEPWDWTHFHEAAQGAGGLVVADLTKHAQLREEPLVRGGIVGSYAGVPLVATTGARLGTLCILDTVRGALGPEELGVLVGLARRITGDLESRARVRATEREAARLREVLEARDAGVESLEYLREALQAVDAGVLLVDGEGRNLVTNARLAELLDVPAQTLPGMTLEALSQHLMGLCADPLESRRRMEQASDPSGTLAVTLELERPRPRVLRWVARPVQLPGGRGQLSTFTELPEKP